MVKLSELMNLGAMIRPQGYGSFLQDGKSCGWGAVLEAMGLPITQRSVNLVAKRWDHLFTGGCPACESTRVGSSAIVLHLNDHHHWTREAIATWIEGLELAHEARAADVAVAHV